MSNRTDIDNMERACMELSIEDVLETFDNTPVPNEMIGWIQTKYICTRASALHLEIEIAWRKLLDAAELAEDEIRKKQHNLEYYYKKLVANDPESAEFLERAFKDAVDFYGIQTRVDGLRHCDSLEKYLHKTATGKRFNDMRYWLLTNKSLDDADYESINGVFLDLHREILVSTHEMFLGNADYTPQAVTERLDMQIRRDLLSSINTVVNAHNLTCTRIDVEEFYRRFATNPMDSLKEAFDRNFELESAFESKAAKHLYVKLLNGERTIGRYDMDAVPLRYFLRSFELVSGLSERPGASVACEWIGDSKTKALLHPLNRPDEFLGEIHKYTNGSFGVTLAMNGLLRESARAKSCEQALRYVAHAMSEDVYLQINNGPFEVHVALKEDYGSVFRSKGEWVGVGADSSPVTSCTISFWNSIDSLNLDDHVKAIHNSKEGYCWVFEGMVEWLSEDNAEVKLKGHKLLDVSVSMTCHITHDSVCG